MMRQLWRWMQITFPDPLPIPTIPTHQLGLKSYHAFEKTIFDSLDVVVFGILKLCIKSLCFQNSLLFHSILFFSPTCSLYCTSDLRFTDHEMLGMSFYFSDSWQWYVNTNTHFSCHMEGMKSKKSCKLSYPIPGILNMYNDFLLYPPNFLYRHNYDLQINA